MLSWSSGKDSAWALQLLRLDGDVEVTGLFTTVNRRHRRVAMHAVRLELLLRQSRAAGLPVEIIELPDPCSDARYESIMADFVTRARSRGVGCMAFGDLYLSDIRRYREQALEGTGIEAVFPLWGMPTRRMASEMLAFGLRAVITCVDPRRLDRSFAGSEWAAEMLGMLPEGVDPCGENGEFHTFAYDGPMFRNPVEFRAGEIVDRDGFVFADLLP